MSSFTPTCSWMLDIKAQGTRIVGRVEEVSCVWVVIAVGSENGGWGMEIKDLHGGSQSRRQVLSYLKNF